tara:strand:+ start:892 stop:1089 length:198 start_codon:yes stop_codon:yes gene_type:complete
MTLRNFFKKQAFFGLFFVCFKWVRLSFILCKKAKSKANINCLYYSLFTTLLPFQINAIESSILSG